MMGYSFTKRFILMFIFLSFGTFFCSPALCADHMNLERNLPAEVEDAYATHYMNREIQIAGRYERTHDGKDRFNLEPVIEYGFAHNAQVSLSSPFLLGNADETGSGNVLLDVLYNFNTESVWLPAFSIAGEAEFPTGKKSAGLDTTLKFIVSKMVYPRSTWMH